MTKMMDKLISQQAAFDVVAKWIFEVFGIKESDGTATVFKRLRELPSAQPEHKTGRWIPTASGKGRHECSRCHEYAPCYQDGSEHLSTFCVLCGAKMERGEEE